MGGPEVTDGCSETPVVDEGAGSLPVDGALRGTVVDGGGAEDGTVSSEPGADPQATRITTAKATGRGERSWIPPCI